MSTQTIVIKEEALKPQEPIKQEPIKQEPIKQEQSDKSIKL